MFFCQLFDLSQSLLLKASHVFHQTQYAFAIQDILLNLNHVSQPHSSPQSLINKQMEIFSVCVCVYVCICMCVWYFIIFVDDWKNRIQCLETAFLLSSALPNKARKSQSNTQSNHNICFIPILGNSFPNVSSFIVFLCSTHNLLC